MPTAFDLMVAPTGARLGKADHPALPTTQAEIIDTAKACWTAGATSIHVHVRYDNGSHSLDADRYNALTQAINATTPLAVQVSTEAADMFDVAAQYACIAGVNSRHASVALREIARAPDQIRRFYQTAKERGVRVQHIMYDAGDVQHLIERLESGAIPDEMRDVLFVLGRYTAGQRSEPDDLTPFLEACKGHRLRWSLCAFGPSEQACLLAGLNEGGHARIGFENNRVAPDGSIFPDNATSVASFVEAADKAGFTPQRGLI